MDPEKVKAALDAIKNGDADAALAILEEMIATAAGGEAAAPAPEESAALADAPDEPPPSDEEKAAMSALKKLVARDSASEIVTFVTELVARERAVEAERATLELSERRVLIADLVKLSAETPATAWANAEKREPCARLANEPIAELRERVKALKSLGKQTVAPPLSESDVVKTLSKAEFDACKKRGIDPKDFAERKANAVRRSK